MEERRKALEEHTTRLKKRNVMREGINQTLCLNPAWWGECESDIDSDDVEESEIDEVVYVSFLTMPESVLLPTLGCRLPRMILDRCSHSLQRGYQRYSTHS